MPQPGPRWSEVAVPREHGGWSLTAEPAVLGLLVAWSVAGSALAGAALIGFMVRTPLKVVLVDHYRQRWLPRSRLAARIAAGEGLVLVALGAVAVGTAQGWAWLVPLVVAAPLVGLELWYDMRSRSRRLIPELAGTVGIGSVAAAIALAGGTTTPVAIGLWWVMAARAVAALPHVRVQVVRARQRGGTGPGREGRRTSDGAQVLAVAAVGLGVALGPVPMAALVITALVAAVHLVAIRSIPWPVALIGISQIAIGLAVVLATGLAVLAPSP